MKRYLFIVALAVVLVGAVCMRGRARPIAILDGQVRQIVAGPRGVFWIETPMPGDGGSAGDGPCRVVGVPHGGGRPVVVAQEYDLRSLFLDDDRLLIIGSTGPEIDSGQLIVLDLNSGRRTVHSGLHRPCGIWARGERICWAEGREARGASVVHVPVLQHLQAIRAGNGNPATARLLGVAESSRPHFSGQILGSDGTYYYWAERVGEGLSEGATTLRRCPENGGEVETLGRAAGPNVGLLTPDSLVWTAYSEEMNSPGSGRCARMLPLKGGQARTVTDWLPSSGTLVSVGRTVWYGGAGYLWRIPDELDEPVPVARTGAVGPGQAAVYGGNTYSQEQLNDKAVVMRRPISPWGRVRAALTLPGSLKAAGQVAQ
ncbi:MAG: hypothetical protein HPY44_04665 [Armatimonadetes bacterium]|nr:hypothetical protein [Armatimonadota bacterium]